MGIATSLSPERVDDPEPARRDGRQDAGRQPYRERQPQSGGDVVGREIEEGQEAPGRVPSKREELRQAEADTTTDRRDDHRLHDDQRQNEPIRESDRLE